MFNSPSSGYVLTPPRVRASTPRSRPSARRRRVHSGRRAAVCCTSSRPNLAIWECDLTVYRAGWLRDGHRRPGATRHRGLSLRDAAAADHFRVLGPVWNDKLIEAMDYADEVRAGPVRHRHGVVVHLLSRAAGLLHALGRRVQVRGVGARSADRRLPAFATAASRVARRRAKPRSTRVSPVRTGLRLTATAIAEGATDRCTVSAFNYARNAAEEVRPVSRATTRSSTRCATAASPC